MVATKITDKEAFDISEFTKEAPNRKSFGSIIISIGMLLVVLSIAYSTYRVFTGTSDIIAHIMIIPQSLFASSVLVKQFIK